MKISVRESNFCLTEKDLREFRKKKENYIEYTIKELGNDKM